MAIRMKRFHWKKYLLALIATFFIFTSGLYIGNYTTNFKVQKLYDIQNDISSEVLGTELQYQIMEDNLCSIIDLHTLVEDLEKIGGRLTAMEAQLGFNNKAVLSLKEYYHLLEIRHYLFMKDANQKCNKNYSLVLYFYSNAGDCDDCQEQGYVLSYVNKKSPTFNIYSFDVNIDNPAINALKQVYNITRTPSIVINGVTYPGSQNKEKLMSLLANEK